jgi:tRNA pseudouridine-54 N-methylase
MSVVCHVYKALYVTESFHRDVKILLTLQWQILTTAQDVGVLDM